MSDDIRQDAPPVHVLSTSCDARSLGGFICAQNPYPWVMDFPHDIGARAEEHGPGAENDQAWPFAVTELPITDPRYWQGVFVTLGGATHRMSKAMRIPYHYPCPETGKTLVGWLIVGYEGGGGGQ